MLDALKRLFAKKQFRFRSAVTGRWVSAAFAARHPSTTIRVRIK